MTCLNTENADTRIASSLRSHVKSQEVITRAAAYGFGAATASSLIVLFAGLCVFGFNWAFWHEWQGRIVGIAVTAAAIAGAVLGLWMASRTQRRLGQEKEIQDEIGIKTESRRAEQSG